MAGLAGPALEPAEVAVLAPELAEHAASGAATATDAMSMVMDFEISTAGPFFEEGGSTGYRTRGRETSTRIDMQANLRGHGAIRQAMGLESGLQGKSGGLPPHMPTIHTRCNVCDSSPSRWVTAMASEPVAARGDVAGGKAQARSPRQLLGVDRRVGY